MELTHKDNLLLIPLFWTIDFFGTIYRCQKLIKRSLCGLKEEEFVTENRIQLSWKEKIP